MNAYQQLRARARQKRDEAIKDAKSIYNQTIKRIDMVERSLGKPVKRDQPVTPEPVAQSLIKIMVEIMPKDRPFEGNQLTAMLRRRCPDREINTLSVRTYLHRLAVQGVVRRVTKPKGHIVQWAAKECPAGVFEDEAAALVNVAEAVLRESGPMTMMQLTLAVQARGTRPGSKPRSLMECLRRSLCHNQGRFVKSHSGRWTVTG